MFFRRVTRWRVKRRKRVDERVLLRYRLWLLQGLVVLAFGILTMQLWRLQIVEGAVYRDRKSVV